MMTDRIDDKLCSTRLSTLLNAVKVPLIIGIVIIHSNLDALLPDTTAGRQAGFFCEYFSNYLCRACVPVFFIISGYLFFANIPRFDLATYKAKLRRRATTLLIPYLIWNIIGFLLLCIKASPLLQHHFPQYADLHLTPISILGGFWWLRALGVPDILPYDGPLWFIRNLIVLVIATPAIHIGLRYLRWWFPALLLVLELLGLGIFNGLLYFTVGAAATSISPRHLLRPLGHPLPWVASWLLFALVMQCFNAYESAPSWGVTILATINVAFGLMSFMSVTSCHLLPVYDTPLFKLLRGSVFFIFAVHGLYSTLVRRIFFNLLPPTTIGYIGAYLSTIIILLASSLLVYLLITRISPRLASLLSGGRATIQSMQITS